MENTNDEQEHTAKDDDFCSGLNGRRVAIKKSGYSIVDFGEDVISLFAIAIIISAIPDPPFYAHYSTYLNKMLYLALYCG